MKTELVRRVLLVSISIFLVALGALYLVSGRTVRAVCFLAQGWSCHHIAHAFSCAELPIPALAVEKIAMQSYENVEGNLTSSEVVNLIADELAAQAKLYVKYRQNDAGLETLIKLEKRLRDAIAQGAPNALAMRQRLSWVLLFEARIEAAEERFTAAADKFRQVILTCDELEGANMSDSSTQSRKARAKKDLEDVLSRMGKYGAVR